MHICPTGHISRDMVQQVQSGVSSGSYLKALTIEPKLRNKKHFQPSIIRLSFVFFLLFECLSDYCLSISVLKYLKNSLKNS